MKVKKIRQGLGILLFTGMLGSGGGWGTAGLAALPLAAGSATDPGPLEPGAAGAALVAAGSVLAPEPEPALARWDQPVPHLFFHPLIARPAEAFREGQWRNHLYEWFITVEEFRRLLEDLHARGYVLVDVWQTLQPGADGAWSVAPFDFPAGKTPLLLSIDDLNYYAEMRWNGTASRLEVDSAGQLRTRRFAASQVAVAERPGDTVAYDNEIPLILEDFVARHPDFSWHGARGIVALTGKRGLFGWPTHLTADAAWPQAVQGARAVAGWLRARGWHFASHSYWHQHRKDQSAADFDQAERRWVAETRDILGPTALYIFPFGEPLLGNQAKRQTLTDLGFRVFFSVEAVAVNSVDHGLPVLGRLPIDGRALDGRFGAISRFCSRSAVRDPARPARPAGL